MFVIRVHVFFPLAEMAFVVMVTKVTVPLETINQENPSTTISISNLYLVLAPTQLRKETIILSYLTTLQNNEWISLLAYLRVQELYLEAQIFPDEDFVPNNSYYTYILIRKIIYFFFYCCGTEFLLFRLK